MEERRKNEAVKPSVNLTLLSIYVGGGLLFFGVILFLSNINIAIYAFCIGFAIILAAFGTTANIKYKGATITGCGAIAAILIYLYLNFIPVNITHVIIKSTPSFKPQTQIFVEDGAELLMGAFIGRNASSYEFIIEGDKISSEGLNISIDDANLTVEKEQINKYLKNYLTNKKEDVVWLYDSNSRALFNKKKETISTNEGFTLNYYPAGSRKGEISGGICYALPKVVKLSDKEYEELFTNLQSEDLKVRIFSRSQLIRQGIEVIGPVIDKYQKSWSVTESVQNVGNYRLKSNLLFILAAIADQITKEPDSFQRFKLIQTKLTEEHLKLLIHDARDPDNTINQYASRFLRRIADPRVANLAKDEQ